MTRDTLDLRGVKCPLSWARAKVHLESLAAGEEVDVLLDDAQGAADIPRAAEAAGHHVVGVVDEEVRDVAAAAVFYASADAEFLTGTTLLVDGGMTAGYQQREQG